MHFAHKYDKDTMEWRTNIHKCDWKIFFNKSTRFCVFNYYYIMITAKISFCLQLKCNMWYSYCSPFWNSLNYQLNYSRSTFGICPSLCKGQLKSVPWNFSYFKWWSYFYFVIYWSMIVIEMFPYLYVRNQTKCIRKYYRILGL